MNDVLLKVDVASGKPDHLPAAQACVKHEHNPNTCAVFVIVVGDEVNLPTLERAMRAGPLLAGIRVFKSFRDIFVYDMVFNCFLKQLVDEHA